MYISEQIYYPGDEQWQRNACSIMGLRFVKANGVVPGGPNVPLTRPNRVIICSGLGNC